MNTKYMSREERRNAKKIARKARKALLSGFSSKERDGWNKAKGEKGLRAYAKGIGKDVTRPEIPGQRKPGEK